MAGRSRPSQELYGRLIHGYNRQLRPVRRPDVPVRVRLGASLVEVLGLEEAKSHITLKIWLTLVSAFLRSAEMYVGIAMSLVSNNRLVDL